MTKRFFFTTAFFIMMVFLSSATFFAASGQAETDTAARPPIVWFVDSEGGDDVRDGQSEATAWRSLVPVNHADVKPGDCVLFKRGGTFRGRLHCRNGEPGKPVVYSAYGDGAKPRLLGSVNLSSPVEWTRSEDRPEIWTADPWIKPEIKPDGTDATNNGDSDEETPDGRRRWTPTDDVGNLIMVEKASQRKTVGVKRWSLDELTADGDFFSDPENGRLSLYSDVPPTEKWVSIEAALNLNIVSIGRHIVIDSLMMENGASHGVGGGNNLDITVKNCDFAWIGGANLYAGSSKNRPTRYGNGVEFFNGARDCRVENNRFAEIYDVAMTIQGPDPCVNENLIWRNNLVVRCTQAFEVWFTHKEASIRRARFERNTCLDSGLCWGGEQRPDKRGTPLLAYRLNLKEIDLTITENVFCQGTNSLIDYLNHRLPDVVIDHNVWWSDAFDGPDGRNAKLFIWMSGESDERIPHSFEDYRRLTGNDLHSVLTRPEFANRNQGDYRILNRNTVGNVGADLPPEISF